MKFFAAILVAILLFGGLAVGDVGAQVTNNKTFTLNWTATGDDAKLGTATTYDLRYSVDSLTLVGWTNAIQVANEPAPKIAGSAESFSVSLPLLEGVKYYFALKVIDDAGNTSGLSNILVKFFPDLTPPDAVIDLR